MIDWTAHNFTPDVGNFHVHFFYDIYAPEQVGSNAALYGVSTGDWALTDDQPFSTAGTAVAMAGRPAEAQRICVVPADSGHGVTSPENAECVDIPEGASS